MEDHQRIVRHLEFVSTYNGQKALGGKTPARAAGVKFDAPDSGIRIESLIRMAAYQRDDTT